MSLMKIIKTSDKYIAYSLIRINKNSTYIQQNFGAYDKKLKISS